MSTVKTNNVQIGQSLTATNNFTWYQPSTPDGTVRLGVGNAGATTSDVVTVSSSGLSSLALIPSGSTVATNGFYLPAANTLGWSTGSTERMRLDSSGNLGLGVTPSGWGSTSRAMQFQNGVSVFSNTSGLGGLGNNVYSIPGTADYYIANGYATRYYQYNGTHVWNTAASGTAGNAISFTQAMTLDASGNLLVGGTTSYGGKIQSLSTYIRSADGNSSQGCGFVASDIAGNEWHFGRNSSNGYYYVVRQTGTGMYMNTNAWVATSDIRAKKNVVDLETAVGKINALRPVRFDWISDDTPDVSFIAQEVLSIIPEAVDAPEDPEAMMGISKEKMIPFLVKAIQELAAELNELKAKVNA